MNTNKKKNQPKMEDYFPKFLRNNETSRAVIDLTGNHYTDSDDEFTLVSSNISFKPKKQTGRKHNQTLVSPPKNQNKFEVLALDDDEGEDFTKLLSSNSHDKKFSSRELCSKSQKQPKKRMRLDKPPQLQAKKPFIDIDEEEPTLHLEAKTSSIHSNEDNVKPGLFSFVRVGYHISVNKTS